MTSAPRYQPAVPAFTPAQPGIVELIGSGLTITAVMVMFGRIIEYTPDFLAAVHPGALLLGGCALIAVLSGGLRRVLSSRMTALLIAFTLWAAAGIPFSVWRGGAARTWVVYWATSMLAYTAIAGMLVTLDQCRRAMYAIAVGMLVLVGLSFFLASEQTRELGRYGFDSGSLGNANLLAMVLLMGLPFCMLALEEWRGIRKILAGAGVLVILISVLRTGSRSGLITLGLLMFLAFVKASIGGKIKLVVAGSLLLVIGFSLASRAAMERFRTLLSSQQEAPQSEEEASAKESTIARAMLLHNSLVKTIQHPVLGVGIGMFMVADSTEATQENRPVMWRVSHNAYTQLSSETGIPGLLLYLAVMVLCFKKIKSIRKAVRNIPELVGIQRMAWALWLSLIAYAFASLFASTAYECYFPILAALTVVFEPAALREIRAYEERVRAAASAPLAAVPRPAPPRARHAAAY